MQKIDISVRELVNKVLRKELTLPEMQRGYVWQSTRVRDLLDSLYRGYPSGTILVWETEEDIADHELAVGATQEPTVSQRLLLLDGQQRVTSLTSILSGNPVQVRGKKKPIDILFNLEHPDGPPSDIFEVDENSYNHDIEYIENLVDTDRDVQSELSKRTFMVGGGNQFKNNPLWVPVSDIFTKDFSEILEKVGIESLQDQRYKKYVSRLQQVKNIENYPYVMQKLSYDMSYEEVTEIFVRVNSLGIKLRSSDLALAQITSKWKGFMDLIEEFSAQFKSDEDYIIETGLPVRVLTVFATQQCKFKTVGKLKKEKLEEAWKIAKSGLECAINFVRNNAGVDNLRFLSSPFLLVPIAIYYVKNDFKLTTEDGKKLLKWFYLAHMRGHYGMGSSESLLDADVSILFKNRGLDELINQLFLHVKKFNIDSDDLAYKGIRSPFFSMLYFVFKQNGAKDWRTCLVLSDSHVGKAHTIQYHHIFPKSLIKLMYDKKEVNEIANMAFIGGKTNREITNKEPAKYLEQEIIKNNNSKEALISQLIPIDKNMWELSNYIQFLTWRRNAIADLINNFMKKFD